MSLRILTRKTKLELLSVYEDDICCLLFAQRRTQRACRLFLNYLKEKRGLTRSELSRFAFDLEGGRMEKGFRYSRTRFYTMIRATLLKLGFIAIEQRFVGAASSDPWERRRRDVVEKYVPILQPIPKRAPDGLNLPRLVWSICKAWNDEFLPRDKNDSGVQSRAPIGKFGQMKGQDTR